MQDNLSGKIVKRLRNNKGFTLVEVLIAMFLISIMAVGLIHGSTIALNTVSANREKTRAIAVANEKIEIIRAMDFEAIEMTSENPGWDLSYPELSEDGYSIYYYSTWSDDVEDSYKQVLVSVITADMNEPVEVVTRIYPSLGNAPEPQPGHPAPVNLVIISDSGYSENREITLAWEDPETELAIASYNINRNGELIYNSPAAAYVDYPASNEEQVYYVTAVYDDAVESNPSNSVVATVEPYYPSPQDLAIDGYTGSESTREVLLSWDTPDHPYDIIEYRIYRDGLILDTSQDESYQDLIGTENYVYYVTVFYYGDVESDPSGTVETEPEVTYPPPANLTYYFTGTGNQRWVYLDWERPDTLLTIIEYRIYRNGSYYSTTAGTGFNERIRSSDYTYYITAVYEGGVESDGSNSIYTGD